MLHTQAKFNLPFAPKGNSLLAIKGTKSPNLHYPLLILVILLYQMQKAKPLGYLIEEE